MIDAILVTGLPASGRSTLLARLLQDLLAEDARCAVCVHRHARAFGLETTLLPVDTLPCVHYSEVFDFGSGCLCCSPDGDLSRLLNDLTERRQDELNLTHLLIETTGVADPNPFIKLFDNEKYRQQFTLRCVLNVVDLLRVQSILENKATGDQSAGLRGRLQLRCSDILILNHADELSESFEGTKRMLLSAATEETSSAPEILGPCSFCSLGKTLLSSIAAVGRSERRVAPTFEALPSPSMFQLRFGPGVHDAACSTCCLVRRGSASLEAVLAMLQLLLDSGEAYRIQGYVSFLPQDLEPGHRPILGSDAFPPPLERLWAMPMVVVEGYYRGPLKLSPVLRAAAELAGSTGSQGPWQETAFDSAAADRGGCKIFLCGPQLDEAQLKVQLKQCVAPSFELVCNLEDSLPEAAQAMDRLEKQVTAAMQSISKEVNQDAGVRPSAEAFAQLLAAELAGAVDPVDSGPNQFPTTPHRFPARLRPQRGRRLSEAVEVHWENGVVSVTACCGEASLKDGSGYGVRFVNGPTYETLVLGSDIYCRQSLTKSGQVNGKLVRTLEEWREALIPDFGSIWTLETDLGILLASPFKETLSTQLQRGKVDAYLLTEGIEQAAGKISYQRMQVKAGGEEVLLGDIPFQLEPQLTDSTFQIAWASLADLSYQKHWISQADARIVTDAHLENVQVRKSFLVLPHFRQRGGEIDPVVIRDMEDRFAQSKHDVFRSAMMKCSGIMAILTVWISVLALVQELWFRAAILLGLSFPLYSGYCACAARRDLWKKLGRCRSLLLLLLCIQSA
eukprot:s1364_g4.t3